MSTCIVKKRSHKVRSERLVVSLDAVVNEQSIQRESEISQAIKQISSAKNLDERIQEEIETKLTEAVKPVIEQDTDPETFTNLSYKINVSGFDTAAYREQKQFTYYESSNSASQTYEANEHTFLMEAQEIAQNVKTGDQTNRPYVDAQIDDRLRHIKSVASIEIGLWRVIYESVGRVTFN